MPSINVVNMAGAKVSEMTLSDVVFGAEVNEAVLHAAVRAYLSTRDKVHSQHLQEAKFPVADVSHGSKRVQVEQDRAQQES